MVPKGFVRYHVLESLSRKPMSGSEIMNEIKEKTDGRWKPSPGSIYPLLAWLQDNGYVKEVPTDQSGMKRYELTEQGKALLEEQRKIGTKLNTEERLFPPPFLGMFWFRAPSEKMARLRQSVRKLMSAAFELGADLEVKSSGKAIEQAREALDEAAEKLREIDRKLKEEKE